MKSKHDAYATVFPFPVKGIDIPHWKYVLYFYSPPPSIILYKDTQDNIFMSNILYHIYKEVGLCTLHYQIPIGVTSRCYLFLSMKDDETMGIGEKSGGVDEC